MNRRHIQTGLLFVAVCVIIGLGLALFTMSRGSTDTGNSTAMIDNTAGFIDNTTDAADVKQTATDFLVTDGLRRHPPTWENVGEGPTGTVFCSTDKAHITNGSSRRLNLKVAVKDGDETTPLGSLAAGQTLAFDAGDPAVWIIADADNDAALFQYEVNDCRKGQAEPAAAAATPAAETQIADDGYRPGRCRLVVGGQIIIDGTCSYQDDGHGNVDTMSKSDGSGYRAMIQQDGPDAKGYWSSRRGSNRAFDELGVMVQSGPCWKNDAAEICVRPA
ncbi:hypothetical protein [Sphingomonas sp. CROZ-RG-20F-R02-07]|uniref:hypothetical protein n=1 Tax=Sphingomonas sp. CROZ-RG-20F-R02-07 TaxID=2914832 RepID=UPI001F5A2F6A|nr:hypothetical protein [Sphingomonas sp. CROZ-RG-20F-R02-07]